MSNTALPTTLTTGSAGHIAHTNTVHTEINELSRSTGLRDVTSLLKNGWTVDTNGYVYIERVRNDVNFYWRGLNGSAATSAAILTFGSNATDISNRFGPMSGFAQSAQFIVDTDVSTQYHIRALAANIQCASLMSLGGRVRRTTWHAVSQSLWPTTLPGTAVTL